MEAREAREAEATPAVLLLPMAVAAEQVLIILGLQLAGQVPPVLEGLLALAVAPAIREMPVILPLG